MKRLSLLIVCLATWAAQDLAAQPSRATALIGEHRYTEAIDLLRQDAASFDDLSQDALYVLGYAHLQRARMLDDLAQIHAALGAAYYRDRLTSDGAVASAWNPYFLGRHLFEQGALDEALRYFEMSFDRASTRRSWYWLGEGGRRGWGRERKLEEE